jgi:hypothetical protein
MLLVVMMIVMLVVMMIVMLVVIGSGDDGDVDGDVDGNDDGDGGSGDVGGGYDGSNYDGCGVIIKEKCSCHILIRKSTYLAVSSIQLPLSASWRMYTLLVSLFSIINGNVIALFRLGFLWNGGRLITGSPCDDRKLVLVQ